MTITTVGIDLAKNVFQVQGVDERGKATLKKQLKRVQVAEFFATLPPSLVARALQPETGDGCTNPCGLHWRADRPCAALSREVVCRNGVLRHRNSGSADREERSSAQKTAVELDCDAAT